MLPSAAVGERVAGKLLGLYEPIHGSATELAGKNLANPLGAILSVGLMFTHSFERPELGRTVESAVEKALLAGARTGDIGGTASTSAVTEAVLQHL
jgi:3-isopropylmalate dehydrogenase